MARKVRQIRRKGKHIGLTPVPLNAVPELEARVAMIQALIPVGLEAFTRELSTELVSLVGQRYAREGRQPGLVRWTRQRGSIYLADQKIPVTGPSGAGSRSQSRSSPAGL